MARIQKTVDAVVHQPLRDVLFGMVNINLNKKNVGSAQNSLIDPAMSTAGDYSIDGQLYTKAASSSAFVLDHTTVPAYGGTTFVLTLDANGSGAGRAANVLTSAQISTGAYTTPAKVQSAVTLPTIANTECVVGLYTVIAGSVSHVSGSSSFSLVTSAGGSHLFTDLVNLNRI